MGRGGGAEGKKENTKTIHHKERSTYYGLTHSYIILPLAKPNQNDSQSTQFHNESTALKIVKWRILYYVYITYIFITFIFIIYIFYIFITFIFSCVPIKCVRYNSVMMKDLSKEMRQDFWFTNICKLGGFYTF